MTNPDAFTQRMIIADCMLWVSIIAYRFHSQLQGQEVYILTNVNGFDYQSILRGRYNKHIEREPNVIEENYDYENGIDWLAEMKDSPFDAYYAGALPLGSWPWADIDTVC